MLLQIPIVSPLQRGVHIGVSLALFLLPSLCDRGFDFSALGMYRYSRHIYISKVGVQHRSKGSYRISGRSLG